LVTLSQLQDYGLVDSFDQLTDKGLKAAELGAKHGSFQRTTAAATDAALGRTSGGDGSVVDSDEFVDDSFEDELNPEDAERQQRR
jgi:hypothetical protein